jgi:hypothetical protein
MPDGAWGSKEPSPLERLVAAREAEKKAQRKKDTRVLASLAVVALVLVGGGVFAWLRLIPGSAPSRHHTRILAAAKPEPAAERSGWIGAPGRLWCTKPPNPPASPNPPAKQRKP